MNNYSPDLYNEILICYNYETRNTTVYGNVILCEMELTKSSKELQLDKQGDEDYI